MTDSPQPSLKWSSQFTVTHTSRSERLPGDKILLPQSALEALLSASSNLAAEAAQSNLPQFDPYNSASYSAYRQAESQFQDQRQQLPYPLTFRLVNPDNGRVVYAGIREFSAEEEECELSPFLVDALGLRFEHNTAGNGNAIDYGEQQATEAARPLLTVHANQLPKGSFVKLRPLEAGYDPEDWKALLEQHLRQNFTTLTNGEVLVVHGTKNASGKKDEYRFLVDGFKPDGAEGICVVDTDLEVDIEPLNEEQARETLKRIAAKLHKAPATEEGSSAGGELDLFGAQTGQVSQGYVDYELKSWNKAQAIELQITGENEDLEDLSLLVSPLSATQRARPRIEEHVLADFDGRPTKRIRLEPTNIELESAEALFVTVHAFSPSEAGTDDKDTAAFKHFTLRAQHIDAASSNHRNGTQQLADDIPPNEGDVRCKNCNQWVPQRTLMLHENFCLRNNILCPQGCGQVFQKRSPAFEKHWHCAHDTAFGNTQISRQKHDTIMHPSEVLRCTDCATKETFANIPDLARHRTTTCPAKLILCRFCHLIVPQEGDPDVPDAEVLLSGMTAHEIADGARTTECHLCSRIVRLRDMDTHMKGHELDRLSRPAPTLCRNVNCGRTLDTCAKNGDTRAGTRMGQGPGNDIGLCSVCFGPLYVSMYDPEGKALRRRVERRYLQQLTVGCGKHWCKNEFCKVGRKKLGIEGSVTTKDALPMVKPFIEGLNRPNDVALHFCVDEGSQRRRQLAEMLAAEGIAMTQQGSNPVLAARGGHDFAWCLGAVEAAAGDLDGARQWLKNWAPSRNDTNGR